MFVTRKFLSQALNISEYTIDNYRKEGLPYEMIWGLHTKKKPVPKYNVQAVKDWLRQKGKLKNLTNRKYGR